MAFVREMLFEEDGVLLVLNWILALIVSGLILWGLLYVANNWFVETQEGYGTIIEKQFIESHVSTQIINNQIHTTCHPDTWQIAIQLEDKSDWVYVSETDYVAIKILSQVKIKYSSGRFWKTLNVKGIYL